MITELVVRAQAPDDPAVGHGEMPDQHKHVKSLGGNGERHRVTYGKSLKVPSGIRQEAGLV